MKKVNRVFNAISISLIVLILLGVSGTYLSDYLISIKWFGDYSKMIPFSDNTEREVFCWGARHYWYNFGVFFLFCTALARSIANIVVIVEEKKT